MVVIEAKCYGGRINPLGDPKLTEWFCSPQVGEAKKVKSCHGCNPYKQVSTYADSVMRRLSNEISANRVAIFSTIVFPDSAELSKVANAIGGYTRVVTLSHLAKTISEFELAAVSKIRTNQPKRSPQQIEDLIYKRPMRRIA